MDFTCKRLTRKPLKFLFGKIWVIPLTIAIFGATQAPVSFALGADDIGMYGSILISGKADKAARALKGGRYAEAQGLYKDLIGQSPNEDDFYFGYYYSSRMLKYWPDVGLALEQLFRHKPKYKDKMTMEYGECLYHQNKYADAEPVLRLALSRVEKPSIVEKQITRVIQKGIIEHKPVVGAPANPRIVIHQRPDPRPEQTEEGSHPDKSEVDLNIRAAFQKSESILVAKYRGYDKRTSVSFYRPPKANYRIIEYLKGPPLNKSLPVRYEFHTDTNKEKPDGWKFDAKAMMPKKGSKWIIFIENAVPVDGKFETFHGSYGRMPYNDDTIDDVMRVVEQHKGQTR